MTVHLVGQRTACLGVTALLAVLASGPADGSTFSPTTAVQLCAYTGAQLENVCSVELKAADGNADITLSVSLGSPQAMPAVTVLFTPEAAGIPGSETNGLCANAVDDDGDGYIIGLDHQHASGSGGFSKGGGFF